MTIVLAILIAPFAFAALHRWWNFVLDVVEMWTHWTPWDERWRN